MSAECVELNTGAKMPLIGLGSWQVKDGKELQVSIRSALDAGYRLFDTAYLYQNEHFIGEVLEEYINNGKIKREELFITTKLPFTAHSPNDVKVCFEKQLAALRLDYIDLYLIHCPCPFKPQNGNFMPMLKDGSFVIDETSHLDTWKELEKLYHSKQIRALGVSNFSVKQLEKLYNEVEVKPANNQVECHVYWPQTEMKQFCDKHNIIMTAYAPLGSPGRKVSRPDGVWPEGDPMVDDIVQNIAEKRHKTPAQIILRYLTQMGIPAIPKSVQPDRVLENITIFDFKLSDEDIEKLKNIKTRIRLFLLDFAFPHPFYPFDDIDRLKIPPKPALHLH